MAQVCNWSVQLNTTEATRLHCIHKRSIYVKPPIKRKEQRTIGAAISPHFRWHKELHDNTYNNNEHKTSIVNCNSLGVLESATKNTKLTLNTQPTVGDRLYDIYTCTWFIDLILTPSYKWAAINTILGLHAKEHAPRKILTSGNGFYQFSWSTSSTCSQNWNYFWVSELVASCST